jgi:hypothetical protein
MEERYTKAQLLGEIDRAWNRLNSALEELTPEQMTGIRDPQGWSVKDHLVHMAAWENSVLAHMEGKPRYVGLGVDEQVYNSGDDDIINAAIYEPTKNIPLEDAKNRLHEAHTAMLAALEGMSDEDIYRANSDFQPAGSGERDERPILGMIYSNTAGHFDEHEGWIKSLVSAS